MQIYATLLLKCILSTTLIPFIIQRLALLNILLEIFLFMRINFIWAKINLFLWVILQLIKWKNLAKINKIVLIVCEIIFIMDFSNGLKLSPRTNRENSERISTYYNSNSAAKRYYQPEKNTISNDWASVVENQVHDAQVKKYKEHSLRKSMQSNYYADLDLMRSIKDEKKQVEVGVKIDEKNYIDQATQLMNQEQAELSKEEQRFK